MKNIKDKFAKRVVSYLGKEPVVCADIATRLEFARNQAVKAAMLKKAPSLALGYQASKHLGLL